MSVLTSILAFVVAIGILVVIHELGHYSVARLCGVKVLRFSVGFGKPLVSWISKKDGTAWTIAAVPLGGYVKMLDEREADSQIAAADLPHAFNRQSLGKRFAIVAAGPLANFLLAIVLFAGTYAGGTLEPVAQVAMPAPGSPAAAAGIEGGETIVGLRRDDGSAANPVRSWNDLHWQLLDAALDRQPIVLNAKRGGNQVDFPLDLGALPADSVDHDLMASLGLEPGSGTVRIANVEPGSRAEQAHLQGGDVVRAFDGQPVHGVRSLITGIQDSADRPVTLEVERAGHALSVTLTPALQVDATSGRKVGRIGAVLGADVKTVEVRYGPLESLGLGARKTWDIAIFSWRMFGRMISGQASLKNLSGTVTIADYAGKSARMGFAAFVSFLALVSVSLGVLNLLPIPVLDGGHLLYYSVEAVTGKTISDRWQGILQRAGLMCILALSVVALFNDLSRLFHF